MVLTHPSLRMPHWKWWQTWGWRKILDLSLQQRHSHKCSSFYRLCKKQTEGKGKQEAQYAWAVGLFCMWYSDIYLGMSNYCRASSVHFFFFFPPRQNASFFPRYNPFVSHTFITGIRIWKTGNLCSALSL